jgi:hypothetical protein
MSEYPGVYLLTDEGATGEMPRVYIGEADPVGERLVSHQRTKDFWSTVVFFTSKDGSLNKAHVEYLEAKLFTLARGAKRCDLDNKNEPAPPCLSDPDVAEMDEFLKHILLICPTIGITVFQQPIAATPQTQLLRLNAPELVATGYEVDDGFVVRQGSQARNRLAAGMPEGAIDLRIALMDKKLLVEDGENLRLTQDYTFTSPSRAAAMMLGYKVDGRTAWKDANGRTLKEIQTGAAAAATE